MMKCSIALKCRPNVMGFLSSRVEKKLEIQDGFIDIRDRKLEPVMKITVRRQLRAIRQLV